MPWDSCGTHLALTKTMSSRSLEIFPLCLLGTVSLLIGSVGCSDSSDSAAPDASPSDEPDAGADGPDAGDVTPPMGPLTAIPDVPFDYDQPPGDSTSSGSLPASIGAGEVLNFTDQTVSNDVTLNCSGTEQSPAFVLGGTLQGDNDVFEGNGAWCIFIGTVFDNIQPRTSGDHIAFRNVEIRNSAGKNGSSLGGSNIVMADSEIHHNQGDDRHGIFVAPGADGIWILRNHVHHNGGDGFQACHGCSANPPKNVYLGANVFHSDRENGIDFKYIENVIVELNIIHSLVSARPDVEWCFDDGSGCGVFSSGSDGSAIVVGSDGGPTNVQIINNEIYGTVNAVRLEEGVQVSLRDNNFHDLEASCLKLDKDGFNTVFTGNECRNATHGILQDWRVNFSLSVENNVFTDLSEGAILYETRSVCESSTLVDNVFTNSVSVECGNTTATSESEINALPGASGNTVN